jgi:hypothetical protein
VKLLAAKRRKSGQDKNKVELDEISEITNQVY